MKFNRSWQVAFCIGVLFTLVLMFPGSARRAFAEPRDEYLSAAQWMSFDYREGTVAIDRLPSLEAFDSLSKAVKEPAVKRACELMLIGLTSEKANRGSAQQAIDKARRNVEEKSAAAARGEYTRTEVYYDRDADGKLRRNEIQVNESFPPVAGSVAALSLVQETAPGYEALRRRIARDGARMRAWDELLPDVANRFAGPAAAQPLVKVEFRKDNADGRPFEENRSQIPFLAAGEDRFRGRYLAHNASGRELHNVTLAIEMFHYSTLPKPALRHVYFIPRWERGGVIELSRSFLLDVKRGGSKYLVTIVDQDASGLPQASPELTEMAGIVKMEVALWADETRQPPLMVDLPERAQTVAGELIKQAERTITSRFAVASGATRDPSASPGKINAKLKTAADARSEKARPDKSAAEGTHMLLQRLLSPVLTFMPADSKQVKYARRMLDDFPAVRAELLKGIAQDLLESCAAGARYAGTFGGPSGRGEMVLLFVSRDAQGKKISAEVYPARQPEKRRLLTGSLALDRKTQKTMIMLQPSDGRARQHGSMTTLRGSEIIGDEVLTYRLRLENSRLIGHASTLSIEQAQFDPQPIPIFLDSSPGDESELAEAKEREKSKPTASPAGKSAVKNSTAKSSTARPPANTGQNPKGSGTIPSRPASPPFIPGRPPMPNKKTTAG